MGQLLLSLRPRLILSRISVWRIWRLWSRIWRLCPWIRTRRILWRIRRIRTWSWIQELRLWLRHFGKRSADAEPAAEPEAEPGYLYGGYGGYYGRGYGGYGLGLGYRSYGYGHGLRSYGYGLRSYGYAGHYLGKRSADAEPEA